MSLTYEDRCNRLFNYIEKTTDDFFDFTNKTTILDDLKQEIYKIVKHCKNMGHFKEFAFINIKNCSIKKFTNSVLPYIDIEKLLENYLLSNNFLIFYFDELNIESMSSYQNISIAFIKYIGKEKFNYNILKTNSNLEIDNLNKLYDIEDEIVVEEVVEEPFKVGDTVYIKHYPEVKCIINKFYVDELELIYKTDIGEFKILKNILPDCVIRL